MEIISGVSPFKNYYLNTRLHCHKSLHFPDNNLSQLFLDKDTSYTGWSISILRTTLTGSYDENNVCTQKIANLRKTVIYQLLWRKHKSMKKASSCFRWKFEIVLQYLNEDCLIWDPYVNVYLKQLQKLLVEFWAENSTNFQFHFLLFKSVWISNLTVMDEMSLYTECIPTTFLYIYFSCHTS